MLKRLQTNGSGGIGLIRTSGPRRSVVKILAERKSLELQPQETKLSEPPVPDSGFGGTKVNYKRSC